MVGGCFRVVGQALRGGRILGLDPGSIQVGCEAVVILHAQGEFCDRGGIGEFERDTEVEGRAHSVEVILKVPACPELGDICTVFVIAHPGCGIAPVLVIEWNLSPCRSQGGVGISGGDVNFGGRIAGEQDACATVSGLHESVGDIFPLAGKRVVGRSKSGHY